MLCLLTDMKIEIDITVSHFTSIISPVNHIYYLYFKQWVAWNLKFKENRERGGLDLNLLTHITPDTNVINEVQTCPLRHYN